MAELVPYLLLIGVIAGAGIAVGMLLAPRMTRWADRDADDEEPGAGPR